MPYRIYVIITALLISNSLIAQTHNHDHDHEHANGHAYHRNEIGVANSVVYFAGEAEFAYGLHVHYVRTIRESKFGVGLSYERIFDDHGHNTLGVLGSYRPIDPLSFIVSPGVAFEDGHSALHFAFHFETTYEFEIKNLHIGPLVEFAYDPEDIHISLGIHVGFGF